MNDTYAKSFGTASLLKHLRKVETSIEDFINNSLEPEATDLLEQIKDLVAVTTSLNELATKARRQSAEYQRVLSAVDDDNLQSIDRSCRWKKSDELSRTEAGSWFS
jgi:DNA-binding phage protein